MSVSGGEQAIAYKDFLTLLYKTKPPPKILQVTPGRLLVQFEDQWRAYSINEAVYLAAAPNSFNRYNRLQVPPAGDLLVGVLVGNSVVVSGTVTANQGAAGASPWSITGPATGLNVNEFSLTFDGANNTVAQTAVAAAAVQLVTSGTLYKQLFVENIGGNTLYLGFDNTVTAATGYALAANLGADSVLSLPAFNANLWGISNVAGTTAALLARG